MKRDPRAQMVATRFVQVLVLTLVAWANAAQAGDTACSAPVLAGSTLGMTFDAALRLFPAAAIEVRDSARTLSIRVKDPLPGVALGEGMLQIKFDRTMTATDIWFDATPTATERDFIDAVKRVWGEPAETHQYLFENRSGGQDCVTNLSWASLCQVTRKLNVANRGKPAVTTMHVGLVFGPE